MALRLRNEAQHLDASVFELLDEWGINEPHRRRRLRLQVVALGEGVAQYDRERRIGSSDQEEDEDNEPDDH